MTSGVVFVIHRLSMFFVAAGRRRHGRLLWSVQTL